MLQFAVRHSPEPIEFRAVDPVSKKKVDFYLSLGVKNAACCTYSLMHEILVKCGCRFGKFSFYKVTTFLKCIISLLCLLYCPFAKIISPTKVLIILSGQRNASHNNLSFYKIT
jgi:hypothetical protein